MHMGERLRELRTRRKISQRRAARVLEVDPTTIARWERDGLPHIDILHDFADLFGVPVASLFENVGADGPEGEGAQ